MKESKKLNDAIQIAIEVAIRLGILFLLIAWCFRILYPFTNVILWGIILAVAAAPFYKQVNRRLGDRPKWAAFLVILAGMVIVILPSWLFLDSLVHGVRVLMANMDQGSLTIPPPPDSVADWPLIGGKVHNLWRMASENLGSFLSNYQEQLTKVGRFIAEGILNTGGGAVQFILSIIIAGFLLAAEGTSEFAHRFFRKLVGDRAEEFIAITTKTVANVTKGVIGVAFIQSLLVGLGFLLAGVPYAGVWTLVVLVFGILQLPAIIIVLPVIIYLFSTLNTLPAILWTIYLLLAGASDNVMKPLLMGRGAPVPMLVIFLGVIGGFILSGFLGLFTGAIVLSLGYKLFMAWIGIAGEGQEKENGTG
jgi:predicted PurR-regulated permease PerM